MLPSLSFVVTAGSSCVLILPFTLEVSSMYESFTLRCLPSFEPTYASKSCRSAFEIIWSNVESNHFLLISVWKTAGKKLELFTL